MRTILLLIIAILYLILTSPVLLILWLIRKKHPQAATNTAVRMIRWIFRLLVAAAGTKIRVIGIERIPTDTACLYIGNHRSIFDIIITDLYTPGPTGYVAKTELGKIPLLKNWAILIGCLFFNRHDLKEGMKMILDGIQKLKNGHSIFIFPEGTRNKQASDLPLLEFHEGSFKMASKSKCPIVPVSISNTIQIWEGHFPWVRRAKVVVEFGTPIYQEDIPAEARRQVGAYVRNRMQEAMERNQALLKS